MIYHSQSKEHSVPQKIDRQKACAHIHPPREWSRLLILGVHIT